MNYKHLFLLFSIAFFLNSCEDDQYCCPMPELEAEFQSGIFVLNEGNFGSSNASVSFINEEEQVNSASVFANINGAPLGDTAQSIELHENIAAVVVNVSNKIEIVNRFTFESLGTISSNLSNPRFAEIIGGNLYVSNWGDGMDPNDDFVAVFSLLDFSFKQAIPVAEGPEKLIEHAGLLYVAHKGGFSFNNIVSVINGTSNELAKEIEVGHIPNSIVVNGNDLWVLSSGKPAYADEETAGELTRIDLTTNGVVENYKFPDNTIHPNNLRFSNGAVYLTINKSVYKYNIGGDLPITPEFTLEEVSVLYGFEIVENKIYVASPRVDFTGNGDLLIYDLNDGSLLDRYTTGINPNGIYFN
ncbi:YncE family protein [Christiangramia echinicola]|uniref:40-residue YVTN family beta-propeller repeat-containing protein n=1 Tax=Christiangramia echinicola TaxID=279359 RepID=A0A1H1KS56_9FLAO|nr:DUF5074 domain-containing protein [Christiangramia echinicola]SDR65124.1 hypothetical protein SAMN04488552_0055 [Christiangramia echinicola]